MNLNKIPERNIAVLLGDFVSAAQCVEFALYFTENSDACFGR